jgi:hypothetical protein
VYLTTNSIYIEYNVPQAHTEQALTGTRENFLFRNVQLYNHSEITLQRMGAALRNLVCVFRSSNRLYLQEKLKEKSKNCNCSQYLAISNLNFHNFTTNGQIPSKFCRRTA